MDMIVMLVTIDSLRYDFMSLYGYSKDTTPFLRKLCKNYRCLTAIVRANAPYTKASFKSIMTGLLPFTKGGYHSVKGLPSIAKTLHSHGYRTIGIPNNDVLSGLYGFNEGFDLFIELKDWDSSTNKLALELMRMLSARSLVKGVVSRLRYSMPSSLQAIALSMLKRGLELSKPYIPLYALINPLSKIMHSAKGRLFLWIHLMETHYPYTFIPELYEEIHGEKPSRFKHFLHWVLIANELTYGTGIGMEELEIIKMFYEAAIRTVDDSLSKLLIRLEELGILKNLLLIVTADHGEEFLEHGAYGHVGKQYITHMYEELLKVPLVIIDFSDKALSKDALTRLKEVELSHVDLYPTLCGLLGLKINARLDGIDVINAPKELVKKPRVILSEASLFNAARGHIEIPPNERIVIAAKYGSWKYIRYDLDGEELFNLSVDPKETVNLIGKVSGEELKYLRELTLKRLRQVKSMLLIKAKVKSIRKLVTKRSV